MKKNAKGEFIMSIVEKRYFVFYINRIRKGKASCNLQEMINVWLKDNTAKEVTKEEYESINLTTQ